LAAPGPVSPPRVPFGRRFTLWISVLVIAVLALVLLGRLEAEAARSERELVHFTLNQLRAQLLLEEARWRLTGREVNWSRFEGTDPVALLEQPIPRYRPQCGAAGPEAAGHWCFDKASGTLLYRPGFIERFEGRPAGADGVWRWRVRAKESMPGLELVLVPLMSGGREVRE